MKNNWVSKHDFNKGGAHKDLKNDYDRQALKIELKEELEEALDSPTEEDEEIETKSIYLKFLEECEKIALKEYERCVNYGAISKFY